MSAQHAIGRGQRLTQVDFHPAMPLATEPRSFARLFVPTLLAVALATGCLGWEIWSAGELVPTGTFAAPR